MPSNIGSDKERQLQGELIQEEHALRPLRDRISEEEKSFDSQLKALDRKSELQDISHIIQFQKQASESIRKQMENLSSALEENEQRLRKSVAEANRQSQAIEEAKYQIEAERRVKMAPLYSSLHRAQAGFRVERKALAQESSQSSPLSDGNTSSVRSQARVPDYGFRSGHEALSTEQACERSFYTHRTYTPNIRPFTRPLMTCNDDIPEGRDQVINMGKNRLSFPIKETFISHESGRPGSNEQTRLAAFEVEADLSSVFGPLETREQSTGSSSLTPFGSSPIDPYAATNPVLPSGNHGTEEAEEPVMFTVSDGFYTSPNCMKGVPVAKIDEGGAYWVASWTKLNDWCPVDNPLDESVEYFGKCEIHPNQLLAKGHYDGVGLCDDRYPIILRSIFQVLQYANNEDPIHWLRNRLAELIARHEKGTHPGPFNLKTILVSFQKSDPIYQQYCKEHRYESIDYASRNKKAHATRFGTGLSQSDPTTKRTRSGTSPLPTERPSKLPRLGSVDGPDLYDVQVEDRMITARPRNRGPKRMPPLLSPLPLNPAYERAIEPSVSAARIKREGSKAIISGSDVLFDLYFISCGKKEYGDEPPSMKFDAASEEILPVHPISGNLSAKFPELVIRATSLEQVTFATGKEVGDIVKLKFIIGEGLKMQLGFRNADDAVVFVTYLSTYNKKLKLSAEDSKRIADHGFFN